MNFFQTLALARQTRRFTRGDGVQVTEGPHMGRFGTVLSWSGPLESSEPTRVYAVRFTDTDDVVGTDLLSAVLQSEPSLNVGKYGGATRGGVTGGWCGGNSYRRGR